MTSTTARAIIISGSPLAPPVVSYRVAEREWRLEADYTHVHDGARLVVPRGFRFDLASVPRRLWWLIAPFELSIAAPLLHDWIYRHAGELPAGSVTPRRSYTRAEADALFRDVMRVEGVSGWRSQAAYLAVRAFGAPAWRRHPDPPPRADLSPLEPPLLDEASA